MLLRAMEEWPVDLSRSFMIGDKQSDIQAGDAAGVPTLKLFLEGDIRGAPRRSRAIMASISRYLAINAMQNIIMVCFIGIKTGFMEHRRRHIAPIKSFDITGNSDARLIAATV